MADVAANQTSNQTINQKHTPVAFEGKASEYFGIWIVNLLLSIVTLGIYSAWAKVRRKKYFYNNTLIENVGFDYHAKPMSILKGRIIAVVLLLIAAINPILQSLVFLVIFIFLPWLVVRGSIFNARNTSHRGLRFDFIGTVSQAVRVFIGLPLLTMVTLGLAAPYSAHEKNQFLVNSHRFGLSQFDMQRVVKQFYKVYGILIAIPLVLFIIGLIAGGVMRGQELIKAKAANQSQPSQSQLTMPANIAAFVPFSQQKIVLAANDVDAPMPTTEEVKTIERVYSDTNPPPATEAAAGQVPEPDVAAPVAQVQAEEQLAAEQPAAEQSAAEQVEQFEGEMQEKLSEQDLQKIQEQMEQMETAEGQDLKEMQQMMQWLENPKMILAGLAGIVVYYLFLVLWVICKRELAI